MRAANFLAFVLLITGCALPEPEPEPVDPPSEPTTHESGAGSGGTAGTPGEVMAGTGGDSTSAGSGGVPEPVAGMGGSGGAQSVGTLAGMGGMPAGAGGKAEEPFCCSGHYNGIGQCVDDGSVCTGGIAGMSGAGSDTTCRHLVMTCTQRDAFGECQSWAAPEYRCGCQGENEYAC